jgi:hypothetical protein
MLATAREIIQGGGVVVVQTEYANARPDIRYVFRAIEDLNRWENAIEEISRLAEQAATNATT